MKRIVLFLVTNLAIVFDSSSEMIAPPNPMTAENASKPPKLTPDWAAY